MRISQLFGRTLREAPAEAEMVSHALAVRAGLARMVDAGSVAYLPLGWRAVGRIIGLIRGALDEAGGQEMKLPGLEAGGQVAAVAELARREVESYRQLPRLVFHFPARTADDPRPGDGLLGLREVTIAEAYSLHLDWASLDETARQVSQAFEAIFARLELPAAPVVAEPASSAAEARSRAFVAAHAQGRAVVLRCDECGYAALREAAASRAEAGVEGEAAPLEKVLTPDCHTIAELARFLGIEERQTLKAVFYMRDEAELVFAVIRGDLDVNEAKLARALGGGRLRPATDDEIEAAGASPGYASPAGLKVRERREVKERKDATAVTVVADPSIEMGSNFAAGANEAGYHFVNVNYPRDFAITLLADIAQAAEGQGCARCGGTLRAERGIELGRAEAAGARYSLDDAGNPRVTALDAGGRPQPLLMGVYSLTVDRLLAAVLEFHHDDAGIVWPRAAAPFDVHLVSLLKAGDQAEQLYADLQAAGFSVLLDDRAESAGVKFADADLIGCPVRLTVSDRSLKAGGVERKRRNAAEREVVPLEEIVDRFAGLWSS